jgi:hypothetical protein
MDTTRHSRAVTLAATAFLVAALVALFAPAALARPTAAQFQRAHASAAGAAAFASTSVTPIHGLALRGRYGGRGLVARGRVPVVPTAAAPAGAAWIAGGILAVLLVAGTATGAAYASRRSRAAEATVTSIGSRPADGEASPEVSRRKAA